VADDALGKRRRPVDDEVLISPIHFHASAYCLAGRP
jgi:hypothetical protein